MFSQCCALIQDSAQGPQFVWDSRLFCSRFMLALLVVGKTAEGGGGRTRGEPLIEPSGRSLGEGGKQGAEPHLGW